MIVRNVALNLAGYAAPLAAAVVLLPPLIARLDVERFGFLALAWVLVGYFSLFDLGIGRSIARVVAERTAKGRPLELAELVQTSLALSAGLGLMAGLLLIACAEFLIDRALNLPVALHREGLDALRILGICLPLVTTTAALRGLLEGGGRFDWPNGIRAVSGILTFGAPLAMSVWSPALPLLALSLALVRAATFAAHWYVCRTLFPALTRFRWPGLAPSRLMLSYGAWVTVSNLVGPLIVYMDRFIIAAYVAIAAVAYYSAPYEVLTRLWLIPAALTGVLFPAFAAANSDRLLVLYRIGVKFMIVTIMPITTIAAVTAPNWLALWLGGDYASQGMLVAQLLCIGLTANCLGYMPFTLIQARGRADVTAKLHMVELPLYIAVLIALVQWYGINGAALAWSLRCATDAAALFLLSRRYLIGRVLNYRQNAACLVATAAPLAALLLTSASLAMKLLCLTLILAVMAVLFWSIVLDPLERSLARKPIKLLVGGIAN